MSGIHTESGSSAPATTRVGVTMIEQLAEDEVFVFGSNLQGFHGAGSAGYAMRGTTANTWREDVAFRDIMSGKNPDRRGLWAVYGVGRGYQEGTSGRSYAIPTVERPGKAGCVDDAYFMAALREFVAYATGHPAQRFLVVKLGANRSEGGYSYLGIETVKNCFDKLRSELALPANIVLPAEYLGAEETRFYIVPRNEDTGIKELRVSTRPYSYWHDGEDSGVIVGDKRIEEMVFTTKVEALNTIAREAPELSA